MKKPFLSAIAVSAVLGLAVGCATQSTQQQVAEETSAPEKVQALHFDFPKDYKNWTHGTSKIILDKSSPLYGFQQVFVNDIGAEAYKRGGNYPEGSIVIIGFYEAIAEGNEIKQGDIIWYAGMKKDARATQSAGWIFDGFDAKSFQSKIDDPINGCYVCHTSMKHRDYIFTSYAGDVSVAQASVPEAVPGRFAFPADMRTWRHSNSKVILDKNSPLYGFQQIYVNDTGFEANKKGGPYPDGSQIIVGFYEPVKEGEAVSQGGIIWYATMKKDSAAAPDTGGWIMDGFDGKQLNSVVEDPVTGCFNCHIAKKDKDYVFSEYVP